MPLKLLLSYAIDPAKAREYYDFVMKRYLPTMHSMGLEMIEAWATAYGDYPDRLVALAARDEQTMQDLFNNELWTTLNEELGEFVTDFNYKVVEYRQGFQL